MSSVSRWGEVSTDMKKLPFLGPSVEDTEDKEVRLLLALCRSESPVWTFRKCFQNRVAGLWELGILKTMPYGTKSERTEQVWLENNLQANTNCNNSRRCLLVLL